MCACLSTTRTPALAQRNAIVAHKLRHYRIDIAALSESRFAEEDPLNEMIQGSSGAEHLLQYMESVELPLLFETPCQGQLTSLQE